MARRARRDRRLDQALVEVQRIEADVHEHGRGAAQREGIGGGHERERRHDDFVARRDVEQQRRHLERRRARVGEQHVRRAERALQPVLTAAREGAIAGELPLVGGLLDVADLVARQMGPVEWNHPRAMGVRSADARRDAMLIYSSA
jgi:hypothetical protein